MQRTIRNTAPGAGLRSHYILGAWLMLGLVGCTAPVRQDAASTTAPVPQTEARAPAVQAEARPAAPPERIAVPSPKEPPHGAVHVLFEQDEDISPTASAQLAQIAGRLQESPTMRVMLATVLPYRGSRNYELAIAEKRLRTVFAQLVSRGVARNRILIDARYRTLPPCSGTGCAQALPYVSILIADTARTSERPRPSRRHTPLR